MKEYWLTMTCIIGEESRTAITHTPMMILVALPVVHHERAFIGWTITMYLQTKGRTTDNFLCEFIQTVSIHSFEFYNQWFFWFVLWCNCLKLYKIVCNKAFGSWLNHSTTKRCCKAWPKHACYVRNHSTTLMCCQDPHYLYLLQHMIVYTTWILHVTTYETYAEMSSKIWRCNLLRFIKKVKQDNSPWLFNIES